MKFAKQLGEQKIALRISGFNSTAFESLKTKKKLMICRKVHMCDLGFNKFSHIKQDSASHTAYPAPSWLPSQG